MSQDNKTPKMLTKTFIRDHHADKNHGSGWGESGFYFPLDLNDERFRAHGIKVVVIPSSVIRQALLGDEGYGKKIWPMADSLVNLVLVNQGEHVRMTVKLVGRDRNSELPEAKGVYEVPSEPFRRHLCVRESMGVARTAYELSREVQFFSDPLEIDLVFNGLNNRTRMLYSILDCEDDKEREVRMDYLVFIDHLYAAAMALENPEERMSHLRAVTEGNSEIIADIKKAVQAQREVREAQKAEAAKQKLATLGEQQAQKTKERQARRKERDTETVDAEAVKTAEDVVVALGLDPNADEDESNENEAKPTARAQRMLDDAANGQSFIPKSPEAPKPTETEVKKAGASKPNWKDKLAGLKVTSAAPVADDK